MGSRIRVTYATLSADNEDLHAAYEEGLEIARSGLGTTIHSPQETPGHRQRRQLLAGFRDPSQPRLPLRTTRRRPAASSSPTNRAM